jgi:prolyl oligopeptidase
MKKSILFILTMVSLSSIGQKLNYPITKKGDVVDDYFGTKIADPYRWLEDDKSAETATWVKAQNTVTYDYLSKIPFRNEIRDRMEKVLNYEKISSPFVEGAFTYFYKNNGLQNQYVVYRRNATGKEEVFLDPNTFSKDGTNSLAGLSFSKDGSKAAYSISEGGSDWRKVVIINAKTKVQLEDTLLDVKFSGVYWKGNDGFYYSSYDKPKGSQLSAKTDQHKLYYHKLGTAQKDDQLIFGLEKKRRYVGGYVTEDDNFLVISASTSTNGNELYFQDLKKPNSPIINIVDNFDNNHNLIDHRNGHFLIKTDLNAPNAKVVVVNVANPKPENWKDLIPETENVLDINNGAGYLFADYTKDAVSKVMQFDYNGKLIREIKLPALGSAGGFGGKKNQKTVYYSFSNYTTPNTIFSFEPKTGLSKIYKRDNVDFKTDEYESVQVFYNSKDGTKIPMTISYKKGIKLDGSNPTMLYGYGGFNVNLTPGFSATNAIWLENGGIYAVANLRGGGEYGKKWHDAGIKLKKQNVFDDFIAAAEYLIANKYTSSAKLAIRGGSNGGLLVGATMTQRPDLVAVALPAVGVMDMLRYHTFTAGAGWAYDYGTANDNKEMFEYIKNYSPVHNVREGVKYPATLVTTGDHDDRVVPAHSFKFATELQVKQAGPNPTLIRIEVNAGHGAGKSLTATINENADIQAFTLYNMGIMSLPKK